MKLLVNLPAISLQRTCLSAKLSARLLHTNPEEWTDTPRYPPIKDLSQDARRMQRKQDWYDKINNLPTCEQKIVEMNMPRYYGHYSIKLRSNSPSMNGFDFLKFATRTIVERDLPKDYYADVQPEVDGISKQVIDLILAHQTSRVERDCEDLHSCRNKAQIGNFIRDLARTIIKSVSKSAEDLNGFSLDRGSRMESAWLLGGVFPHEGVIDSREKDLKSKNMDPEDRVHQWIRCSTSPDLAIRSFYPLPDIVDRTTHELAAKTDEIKPQDTKSSGYIRDHKRAVIVPGFWPGCINEHGHSFFHTRKFLIKYTTSQDPKMHCITNAAALDRLLDQSLLMSAFTQAHSHAFYQGFTPFNEMSHPIVQQTVSTDGRNFKFVLFQLNACNLLGNDVAHNPYNNIMWMSKDMPLFECIENDQVKGLNEDVIKLLCSMLLKKGVQRREELPFEKNGYKYLMDHDAPEELKENFMHKFHTLTSERPNRSTELKPEIFAYEKIYDTKFKMRPKDKGRKWYQSSYGNKFSRRLDDYLPMKIPRDLRANVRIHTHQKIDSEKLFKMDRLNIKRARLKEGDPEFNSMNQTDVRYTRKSFMKYMRVREVPKS